MIIDCHLHIFPDELARRAVSVLSQNSGLTAYTDGSEKDTLAKLNANGVDIAVALNIAKKPNQDFKVNNFALEKNCERIIHFGSVNPYSENVEKELERIFEGGLKGIKLHPEYQEFQVDDKIAYPIYQKCSELGLRIAFHAGWDIAYPFSSNAHPKYLRNVIDKFPQLKAQFAHFGGMMRWNEVEEYLVGSNAYFDISMVGKFLEADQALRIIEKQGIDSFLFGTDAPWECWQTMYDFVESLKLYKDDYDKLMYKNAIKYLDLNIGG